DVSYVLRQLRKSPGFALSTMLTLALGIGAATAMFAIVDGVLLRPLTFPHAQQLYQPGGIDAKGGELFGIPYADIQQWREATHNTAEIAFSGGSLSILDTPEGAELISNVESSLNLLSVLRVQPMLGRSFLTKEQEDGNSHVVLLSYGLWRQAFSADRKILGKIVHISGVPYSVVGVMPPQFIFPLYENRAEVWTPLERTKLLHESIHDSYAVYDPVLRLKPDYLPTTVQAQLSIAQAHFAQSAQPGEEVATHVRLTSLHDFLIADVRPALTALEIAVVLVWLIACCNVAGLLLSRIAARRTEIAVRGALGAGKLRIVRQFLTESLLLSCAGSLAGLGLAMSMLQLFRHMLQKSLPLSQ
ncbi:MAG: ABC transporter permease, partial [Terriglobia bacterium]|nr:ABC transporter permease [Terriglobia bacterium]